eukprot:10618841-Ditylum_brightwellii.AAC.1
MWAILFSPRVLSQKKEELVAEGGMHILESLLDFYVRAAMILFSNEGKRNKVRSLASKSLILKIVILIIRTMAGVTFFESGRTALLVLDDPTRLCQNWRRCIDETISKQDSTVTGGSLLKKYALEGVANMARSADLQNSLVGSGIIWPIAR